MIGHAKKSEKGTDFFSTGEIVTSYKPAIWRKAIVGPS